MKNNLKYFAFVSIILISLFGSSCALLSGFNVVGTWDVFLTSGGDSILLVVQFTGTKNSGNASTTSWGNNFNGTFTRAGRDLTIELDSAVGTITLDWTFENEDRANGTAVLNVTVEVTSNTWSFIGNRRNIHSGSPVF